MTEILEGLCDLAYYVGVKGGRGDGWVSELTAMQIRFPAASEKRVLLLEAGYPLTSILDPKQGGYLTDDAIAIGTWTDEDHLLTMANNCAFHMATQRRLPPVL